MLSVWDLLVNFHWRRVYSRTFASVPSKELLSVIIAIVDVTVNILNIEVFSFSVFK